MRNMLTGERQTTAEVSRSDKTGYITRRAVLFGQSDRFIFLSAFTLTIKSIYGSMKSEDNARRF